MRRKVFTPIDERINEAENNPLQVGTFFQVVGVIGGIVLIIIKFAK